jgi:nucleoside-triphosphatase THEP1
MSNWALLVGGKGQGKSTAARRVAERLAELGVGVAGFFQQAVEEDGVRVGYRLRRFGREDALHVAWLGSATRRPEEELFCAHVFDNGAFATARRWLSEDAPSARVLVLDEVSKLEVAAKGHHDAVVAALGTDRLVVLAVRAEQLFYVVERFGLDDPVATLDVGDGADEEPFIQEIARAARRIAS